MLSSHAPKAFAFLIEGSIQLSNPLYRESLYFSYQLISCRERIIMSASNGDLQHELQGEELWRHSSPKTTQMWKFLEHVNSKHRLTLSTYGDLHKWSVENISKFWEEVWHFTGIRASKPYTRVSSVYSL